MILESARTAFAERGFAGATTRQIAEGAGVGEPLIFSNFGGKAALFAEAVVAPFDLRFREFLAASERTPPDREKRSALFVHSLYPFLRDNAGLLHAMLKSTADVETPPLHALDAYFRAGAASMRDRYATLGLRLDIAPELVVRYAFGMLAGAVLFSDWFFPDASPAPEEEEATLARMLFKATDPATPADRAADDQSRL